MSANRPGFSRNVIHQVTGSSSCASCLCFRCRGVQRKPGIKDSPVLADRLQQMPSLRMIGRTYCPLNLALVGLVRIPGQPQASPCFDKALSSLIASSELRLPYPKLLPHPPTSVLPLPLPRKRMRKTKADPLTHTLSIELQSCNLFDVLAMSRGMSIRAMSQCDFFFNKKGEK